MVKAKKEITQEQLLQIQKAVQAAEKTTRGEIVPVAIAKADHYEHVRYRTPLLAVLLSTGLLFLFTKHLSAGLLFLGQIISYAITYFLLNQFPKLKYLVLSAEEINREVDRKSLELFHEYHLEKTENRTGILIAIFLEERRVKILADIGINQLVPPKTWDLVVSDMITEIKNNHISSAMVLGINRCGEILSQKIPTHRSNRNELNDNLRTK
jgi:uncharacterized membrane protein